MNVYTPLSRIRLLQMDEAELRTEVLIPLFGRMGYRDVNHNHGVGELGKDIVMWRPVGAARREDYAVVVKAEPVTGQAKVKKGTAGEVFMQVMQALGTSYPDRTTLQARKIKKVIVVTSHAIRAEAAESLQAALSHLPAGTVTLMGGDKLWEALEEFSPERTLGSQLAYSASILDQLSPDYQVTTHIRGQHIQLGLEPKHAAAPPLHFSAHFKFPRTPAGEQARAAFESHIRLGTPVTIPSQFIEKFDVPRPLDVFFATVDEVRLASADSHPIPIAIVARHGEEKARLAARFRKVRGGRDEIEIETVDGDGPFRFNLVANRSTRRVTLTFRFIVDGQLSAKRQLEIARFAAAIAHGGECAFINETDGTELVTVPVPSGAISAPPDPRFVELLEAVLLVEQRCRVRVPIPLDEVPVDEAEAIIDLADRLRAGIWEGAAPSINLTLKAGAPTHQLTDAGPEGTRVAMVSEGDWLEAFGIKIPLGQGVHVATHMRLADASRKQIGANQTLTEMLTIRLDPTDASQGLVAYTKWLTTPQLQELRNRLPGLEF